MNYIVTTTINKPTKALKLYAGMKDWHLLVVGDLKTPDTYDNFDYLSPKWQEENYSVLSDKIGWNCIQRRNIGIIEAYKRGAEIIALVDDDNIPYPEWGKNSIKKEILADYYETENPFFDPLSVTNYPHLWHRGFPIELIPVKNNVVYKGKKKITPLIQADLWDGDPDVDAIGRITYQPLVKFDTTEPFFSNKPSPFNSQNTFISRDILPDYFLFPHVGRMDDIWASYICNKYPMVYAPASVYQERNQHNLISDMKAEMLGYQYNLDFLNDYKNYIDDNIYQIYRSYFK
jgi:hypothetical protein